MHAPKNDSRGRPVCRILKVEISSCPSAWAEILNKRNVLQCTVFVTWYHSNKSHVQYSSSMIYTISPGNIGCFCHFTVQKYKHSIVADLLVNLSRAAWWCKVSSNLSEHSYLYLKFSLHVNESAWCLAMTSRVYSGLIPSAVGICSGSTVILNSVVTEDECIMKVWTFRKCSKVRINLFF